MGKVGTGINTLRRRDARWRVQAWSDVCRRGRTTRQWTEDCRLRMLMTKGSCRVSH